MVIPERLNATTSMNATTKSAFVVPCTCMYFSIPLGNRSVLSSKMIPHLFLDKVRCRCAFINTFHPARVANGNSKGNI